MAASAVRQTLSRYHESGERLITPMTAGSELNRNTLSPMENSLTLAFAASGCLPKRSPNCSIVNIGRKVLEKAVDESWNWAALGFNEVSPEIKWCARRDSNAGPSA